MGQAGSSRHRDSSCTECTVWASYAVTGGAAPERRQRSRLCSPTHGISRSRHHGGRAHIFIRSAYCHRIPKGRAHPGADRLGAAAPTSERKESASRSPVPETCSLGGGGVDSCWLRSGSRRGRGPLLGRRATPRRGGPTSSRRRGRASFRSTGDDHGVHSDASGCGLARRAPGVSFRGKPAARTPHYFGSSRLVDSLVRLSRLTTASCARHSHPDRPDAAGSPSLSVVPCLNCLVTIASLPRRYPLLSLPLSTMQGRSACIASTFHKDVQEIWPGALNRRPG